MANRHGRTAVVAAAATYLDRGPTKATAGPADIAAVEAAARDENLQGCVVAAATVEQPPSREL